MPQGRTGGGGGQRLLPAPAGWRWEWGIFNNHRRRRTQGGNIVSQSSEQSASPGKTLQVDRQASAKGGRLGDAGGDAGLGTARDLQPGCGRGWHFQWRTGVI